MSMSSDHGFNRQIPGDTPSRPSQSSQDCDGTTWPSAGADSNGAHIDFGRQKCSFTLVGETITLLPGPVA